MAGVPDLRAMRIGTESLQKDVANLARSVAARQKQGILDHEAKAWAYAGHQGHRVLVDRRQPTTEVSATEHDVQWATSSRKVGARAVEINPATGKGQYDTGDLYRTVHWKGEGFGKNGRFTRGISEAGLWRDEGLNCTQTRSRVLSNPSQWGVAKEHMTWM
jgi:hypothetical protein|tara:strand:- start:2077 stop:2559 length:483 start_codon:yes stop_codon:yes gene_type:complete